MKENTLTQYNILNNEYEVHVYDDFRKVEDIWKRVAPENIFFDRRFLTLIEDHSPKGLKQYYVIYYQSNEPIGLSLFQLKKIALQESLKFEVPNDETGFFTSLVFRVKRRLAHYFNINTLICGNILLTGEYGFHFDNDRFAYREKFKLVEHGIKGFTSYLRKNKMKIGPILMKDFYEDKKFSNTSIVDTKFTEFAVQPNMKMALRPTWITFDDYMMDLQSKYRVRVKRAFKKLDPIQKVELDMGKIVQYNERMYELYLNIALDAGFNLFELPRDYFIQLQTYLGEKVKMVGYFLDDRLVSYYTIIFNKEYMEAHYLGYDKSLNADHQLYLNMLLDLVKEGIDHKVGTIQFARTALEIKSSVGAEAKEMFFYLKHDNPILNSLVGPVMKFFAPVEEWVPRSPFKN